MKVISGDVYTAVLNALRSYQYGNGAPALAEEVADKLADDAVEVPEGCTPTDARVLRMANHDLAETVDMLRKAIAPFTQFNSSEAFITIKVPTAMVTQARAAHHSSELE